MSNDPSPHLQPSASYSVTMRLHLPQRAGGFASVARAIADAGAILGAIDLVRVESDEVVRDVTVFSAWDTAGASLDSHTRDHESGPWCHRNREILRALACRGESLGPGVLQALAGCVTRREAVGRSR